MKFRKLQNLKWVCVFITMRSKFKVTSYSKCLTSYKLLLVFKWLIWSNVQTEWIEYAINFQQLHDLKMDFVCSSAWFYLKVQNVSHHVWNACRLMMDIFVNEVYRAENNERAIAKQRTFLHINMCYKFKWRFKCIEDKNTTLNYSNS